MYREREREREKERERERERKKERENTLGATVMMAEGRPSARSAELIDSSVRSDTTCVAFRKILNQRIAFRNQSKCPRNKP